MEMKLFQYREQKATQKKKKSKYERWCLSRGGSSHDGSYMASGCGTQEHLIN